MTGFSLPLTDEAHARRWILGAPEAFCNTTDHTVLARVLPSFDQETVDFYRFFDATPHAEFLYACVKKTIEEDLPHETEFLHRYDQFRERIQGIVDMPNGTIDLLFRFLQQNGGTLSKRGREQEFAQMTDAEVVSAEEAYAEAFRASAESDIRR